MPVITDPRKASKALAWAVQEMEARYNCVSDLKCRDLKSYNYKVENRIHSFRYSSSKNAIYCNLYRRAFGSYDGIR